MDFALNKIGADVMADQCSSFLAACLVADHGSHKVKRNANLCQHCRYGAAKVVRGELVDRQFIATRPEVVADVGRI